MGVLCGVGVFYRVLPRVWVPPRVEGTPLSRGVLCGVGVFCRILPRVWVLPRVEGIP